MAVEGERLFDRISDHHHMAQRAPARHAVNRALDFCGIAQQIAQQNRLRARRQSIRRRQLFGRRIAPRLLNHRLGQTVHNVARRQGPREIWRADALAAAHQ